MSSQFQVGELVVGKLIGTMEKNERGEFIGTVELWGPGRVQPQINISRWSWQSFFIGAAFMASLFGMVIWIA